MKSKLLSLLALAFVLLGWGSMHAQDGSLDLTFDQDGIFQEDVSNNGIDVANDMAEQPDGKVVVVGYTAGTSNINSLFMRLNEDGSLDSTFGTEGIAIFDIGIGGSDRLNSLAIQPDGKIVATGYYNTGAGQNLLAIRINADGTMDTDFATGGLFKQDFSSGGDDFGNGIALQSDGKIVLVGQNDSFGDDNLLVVRLNDDGSMDPSFGFAGFGSYDPSNGDDDGLNDVAITSDGKIVATGYTHWAAGNDNMIVARLHSNGFPDSTFSSDGYFNADLKLGSDEVGNALTLYANGSILIAGSTTLNSNTDATLIRLKSNGILDNGFGNNGKAYFDFTLGALDEFRDVDLQADNKIIATGIAHESATGYDFLAVKLMDNGDYDMTFNGSGHVSVNTFNTSGDNMRSMCLLSDKRIMIGGYSSGKVSIVRLQNEPVTTGFAPSALQEAIQAYPQPFTNQLLLKLSADLGQELELGIFDLQGRQWVQLDLADRQGQELIDLSDVVAPLEAGLYLLRVNSEQGSFTQRVIKQ